MKLIAGLVHTLIVPLKPVVDLDTVWRVIFMGANFRGKSEKALKFNFKFCDSNQSRGVALLHKR